MTQNQQIAGSLAEIARLLAHQGANHFRVQAYAHAADVLELLAEPVSDILEHEGLDGLRAIPGIGDTIAHVIRDAVLHGRSSMLARLRGESDPVALFASIPGIGTATAWMLHEQLGVESLQELERAAHDGRLASLPGIGPKRLAGIRDCIAQRLGRLPHPGAPAAEPPVDELLDVDREYREAAAAGLLKTIAPRHFNPTGEAWLPVLHTVRDTRHYTVFFSNSARAHELGRTHDWVVLYYDGMHGEHRATVLTSTTGPLAGKRIVVGRETECEEFYSSAVASGIEPC